MTGIRPAQHIKHYVIKDEIARGGMGIVWRAWDNDRREYVAIKAIASDLIADPEFRIRFHDEVSRHARLRHPNIVPVLDVFEVSGQNCFVMDLIEGTSLDKLLEEKPEHRLTLKEAIPILRGVLYGLDYAHRKGIVHRDIKPSNILLDKNNGAHLIDFGIALAVGEERRTRTGQSVGTPHYMSPEQIVRPRTITHLSDVYSVGCVFYEILTGRPPFLGSQRLGADTDFAIKQAHVNEQPVSPKERNPSISNRVDGLIMKALAKREEDRLPGCLEFLRLLEEADVNVPPNGDTAIRRRRALILMFGIFILFLFAIILVTVAVF